MKKEDIKSGMVVKLRKGCWCLAVEHECLIKFVGNGLYQSDINDLLDTLKDRDDAEYDIIAIGTTPVDNIINLNESGFDIVWERDERVELTVEEIEKELGFKIKIVK